MRKIVLCRAVFFSFFILPAVTMRDYLLNSNALFPLVRAWAAFYDPLPTTPIKLYFFDPEYEGAGDESVALMHVGGRTYGRVFRYNEIGHFWGELSDPYEEYELEDPPDRVIAFSQDITL